MYLKANNNSETGRICRKIEFYDRRTAEALDFFTILQTISVINKTAVKLINESRDKNYDYVGAKGNLRFKGEHFGKRKSELLFAHNESFSV